MSFLNWITPEDYSFNSFLLMERFQIASMMKSCGWRGDDDAWKRSMGVALAANPAVRWYLEKRCPEFAPAISELARNAPSAADAETVRAAEIHALESVEDFTIYTTPELMGERCDFIRGWDKKRLFALPDLPFPDNTFDIVMSGHVVGDDWDPEIAELTRVCKSGGWLLDCPGDSERDIKPSPELTNRGWEEIHYTGNFGKDVYNHRKRVNKA